MISESQINGALVEIIRGLNPCSNGRWPLRRAEGLRGGTTPRVLILVLMADGLWVGNIGLYGTKLASLNPCSNGRWSLRGWSDRWDREDSCLNPCSNGRWSLSWKLRCFRFYFSCLNPCSNGRWSLSGQNQGEENVRRTSLNPCSNGRWSLRPVALFIPRRWVS